MIYDVMEAFYSWICGKHPFISNFIRIFCVDKDNFLRNKDQAAINHILQNIEDMSYWTIFSLRGRIMRLKGYR